MKKTSFFIISLAVLLPLLAACGKKTNKESEQSDTSDYGYLYCHMSERGEWTAYALSRDGLNFTDLINGDSVFSPREHARIEGGTRDAYITRTHDGKGYLMVTTDMCVARSGKWNNYGIDLLRSDDLINWESVTFDFRKGPEIFSNPCPITLMPYKNNANPPIKVNTPKISIFFLLRHFSHLQYNQMYFCYPTAL